MNAKKMLSALILLGIIMIGLTQCTKKKGDSVSNATITPSGIGDSAISYVPTASGQLGVAYLDQVHTGFTWKCLFMDLTNTYLNGRFNNYGFSSFQFDPNNLSAAQIHFWVDMSGFNTGQPGRDGNGKCGRSYIGITYKDSAKTIVDSASIWAFYDATTVIKSGSGYIAQGTLKLNRWRGIGGHTDGDMVSNPCTLYFNFNEYKDMGGTPDQHRFGFSGHLLFNRRDYVDPNSTKQWVPTPTVGTHNLSPADVSGNLSAANNTMYGVYMTEVGDSCWVNVDPVFYKNY